MELLIDLAAEPCLALVGPHGRISRRLTWPRQSAAPDASQPLDRLLADARLAVSDLTAILLNTGPGSFTGLRLGASLALGLAYGTDLPILPFSGTYHPALRPTLMPVVPQELRLEYGQEPSITIPARQFVK